MKMLIAGLVFILVGRLAIRMFGGPHGGEAYVADIFGSFTIGVGVGTCLIACLIAVSGVL